MSLTKCLLGKRVSKLFGISFIMALWPFMRALSLRPNYLPNVLTPNIITLDFQHINFRGTQTFSPLHPYTWMLLNVLIFQRIYSILCFWALDNPSCVPTHSLFPEAPAFVSLPCHIFEKHQPLLQPVFWVRWNKDEHVASAFPLAPRQVKTDTIICKEGLLCSLQSQGPGSHTGNSGCQHFNSVSKSRWNKDK